MTPLKGRRVALIAQHMNRYPPAYATSTIRGESLDRRCWLVNGEGNSPASLLHMPKWHVTLVSEALPAGDA